MTKKSFLSLSIAFLGLMLFLSIQTRQQVTAQTAPSTTPRKGFSGSIVDATYHPNLGSWMYTWGVPSTYPANSQVVPMLVDSRGVASENTIRDVDTKTDNINQPHDYWTVFNECEIWDQCWQSCVEVSANLPEGEPHVCSREAWAKAQAEFYHDEVLPSVYGASVYNPSNANPNAPDPDAKLIIGGSNTNDVGLTWMTDFVEHYIDEYGTPPPRAGWHFHIYPSQDGPTPSPQRFTAARFIEYAERIQDWMKVYGSPSDEIWITEMGCLAAPTDSSLPPSQQQCNPAKVKAEMVNITKYLNGLNGDGRWIDRYSWFASRVSPCPNCTATPASWLVYEGNYQNHTALKPLGIAYRDVPEEASSKAVALSAVTMQPLHNSGKCVSLNGLGGYPSENPLHNGTDLHQWNCNGNAPQEWNLVLQEAGVYTIESNHSGKCAGVANGQSATSNAQIHQWSCNGNSTQSWELTQNGTANSYSFENQYHNNMCIEVVNFGGPTGSGSNGHKLKMKPCSSNLNQQFSLHFAD